MKDLGPNRVEHLCLRCLKLFIGKRRSQLPFATAFPDLVHSQGVHGVRTGIRIRAKQSRDTAWNRRNKGQLLDANCQYGIRLIAGNQTRCPVRFNLILRGKYRKISLNQQILGLGQRQSRGYGVGRGLRFRLRHRQR